MHSPGTAGRRYRRNTTPSELTLGADPDGLGPLRLRTSRVLVEPKCTTWRTLQTREPDSRVHPSQHTEFGRFSPTSSRKCDQNAFSGKRKASKCPGIPGKNGGFPLAVAVGFELVNGASLTSAYVCFCLFFRAFLFTDDRAESRCDSTNCGQNVGTDEVLKIVQDADA